MRAILSFTLFAFLLIGCSEDDDSSSTPAPTGPKPTINLIGSNPQLSALNSQYNELGATAFDADSNDISSRVAISGSVNTDSVGNYNITYRVTDTKGVAANPVIRVVSVRNEADYLSGVYTAKQYCGSSTNTRPDFTTSIFSSNSINNRIYFTNLQPVSDTIEANVVGTTINVSSGSSGGIVYSSGCCGYIYNDEITVPISTNLPDFVSCIVTIER